MMFAVLLSLGLAGWAISGLIDSSDEDGPAEDADKVQRGDADANRLEGSDEKDFISGNGGNDTISGESDYDTLVGGAGEDVIEGGNGFDLMEGGTEADKISGGNGQDILLGNDGEDTLLGGDWHDTLIGGAGEDVLEGGNGDDYLNGGLEQQKADGSGIDASADSMRAFLDAAKNDPELFEDGTFDKLFASKYFKDIDLDALKKGAGADGADTLIGGAGNDEIVLGAGDIAWGDDQDGEFKGADIFTVNAGETGDAAIISDFMEDSDKLIIEYDAQKGVPKLTYKISSDELHVMANGNLILRIEDMGDLSAVAKFELLPVNGD